MLEAYPTKPFQTVLRFGGGVVTVASEDEIKERECSAGQNFTMELDNSHFRPRKPFQKMGTATNGANIMGYAQLVKKDNTISTLIQAGDTVYEWDGAGTFTSKGTVSAGAKLRGPLSANWTMEDKVLITDLTKTEVVQEWDGTTFQAVTTNLGTNFYAKYCFVENERAWYGNVKTSSDTPHLIAVSKLEDYNDLSTANRPASSLSDEDPFYLLSPDLRPLNGLVEAFGAVLFSTTRGSMFKFTGNTAKNYAISAFYNGSAATGEESVCHVGNDIYFGREGAIETLSGIQTIGEATVDDLTRFIANEIQSIEQWRLVWDRNTGRLYCFPKDEDEIWVFQKPIYDDVAKNAALNNLGKFISPWSRYTTRHSATFLPTTVWNMLDPATSTMAVYFGDTSGNIYKMEGDSYNGDGGTTDLLTTRTSMSFQSPPGQKFDVNGWILYRKPAEDVNITLTFEYGGVSVFDQPIELTLPAPSTTAFSTYGGTSYYAGSNYYGTSFIGRLTRQEWSAAGRASQLQVQAQVEGKTDFSIAEIGINWTG